ncbi:acyl-CoA synthase [Mycolicibacterium flavescens]|uniref:acyl-CoA synthetase n=1 Tax=Mycobacterium neumannii TaxID=2048551 RepID=UPI000B9403BF|nr:acyl-CoA synthetase [Mycobacterium neumannii]VEG43693.1 acyl-CoA synthase [Mycolicibacterium flavescens]
MSPRAYAALAPDRPAIIMGLTGETVTYRQLEDRSARLAGALRSRGLEAGDHVAVLMGNNRSFLEAVWAAQRSGLYYTTVNSHLRPGEVQYILDDSGAKALISDVALAEVLSRLDTSRIPVRIATGGGFDSFERYEEVLAADPSFTIGEEREGREMLYSSGTTGRPKGIRKPLPDNAFGDPESVPAQIALSLTADYPRGDAVYLCPAPLYHSAPLVGSMSWHRVGGTVVVMERFDPSECLELIERYRVTHAQFVPTMFVRMLRLPRAERERYDVSSLRRVLHTAAPCAVAVKRQMIDWWGPIIDEYYSGTEDLGATFISSEEWLAHPGSVGRPTEECRILGEGGDELPRGEVGIVYFSGGRPFEYHNDPVKTASVSSGGRWRTLGDMGFLDEDGYLYLTDRQANMIVSGGVNIYPQEVEDILMGHPAVNDVAVIGVPDEEMGETVKAVVQLASDVAADSVLESRLIAFCRAELATYKCPRTVDFVGSLPRDPNGKLYKRLLRDRYWEGHETRVV